MKKFFVLVLVLIFTVSFSYAVDERYMPAGYVRDDVIYPYYAKLTSDYFKKVDSGQIEFSTKTYRKEVEIPLGKITDELFEKSRKRF